MGTPIITNRSINPNAGIRIEQVSTGFFGTTTIEKHYTFIGWDIPLNFITWEIPDNRKAYLANGQSINLINIHSGRYSIFSYTNNQLGAEVRIEDATLIFLFKDLFQTTKCTLFVDEPVQN